VIAVLQRGFVYVGRRRVTPQGMIHLSPARCIRTWGTRGVGLMGLQSGPLAETVLETVGEIVYHPLGEVFHIPATGEWGLDG
jgi:hypothetical protein